jgi:hypothetical protein
VLKRALLVGIDRYDKVTPLDGCVNDVAALKPLLARNEDHSPNFACTALVTADGPRGRVIRDRLLASIKKLLAPGADVALLYFAGHGEGGSDVTLVTTDATGQTAGVRFSEVMTLVQESDVPEINIILDCCFSGAAGKIPQVGYSGASLRNGVSILTASRGDQVSAETPDKRGLFSTHLCAALDNGAADIRGKIELAGIWAYITESFGAWEQRPTLKANIERTHTLRTCHPFVPDETLRQFPAWFPTPDHEYPLDPAYEPTENHGDEVRRRSSSSYSGARTPSSSNPSTPPTCGTRRYRARRAASRLLAVTTATSPSGNCCDRRRMHRAPGDARGGPTARTGRDAPVARPARRPRPRGAQLPSRRCGSDVR